MGGTGAHGGHMGGTGGTGGIWGTHRGHGGNMGGTELSKQPGSMGHSSDPHMWGTAEIYGAQPHGVTPQPHSTASVWPHSTAP